MITQRLAAWTAAVVFVAVCVMAAKPMQISLDEMSPRGSNRGGFFNGYAGMDTTIVFPWLTDDWGVKPSAACSVAVGQADTLVDFTANFGLNDPRKVIPASLDTFLAGHPNAGESRIDTVAFPVEADEQYSQPLKISSIRIVVASGTPTIRYWAISNREW